MIGPSQALWSRLSWGCISVCLFTCCKVQTRSLPNWDNTCRLWGNTCCLWILNTRHTIIWNCICLGPFGCRSSFFLFNQLALLFSTGLDIPVLLKRCSSLEKPQLPFQNRSFVNPHIASETSLASSGKNTSYLGHTCILAFLPTGPTFSAPAPTAALVVAEYLCFNLIIRCFPSPRAAYLPPLIAKALELQ